VVISDGAGNTIRNLSGGVVATVAGGGYTGAGLALVNGFGTAANFSAPNFVAVGPAGAVFTCDSGFAACRPINASRFVGSIAGFNQPQGVAADVHGYVYVANRGTRQVLRITPDGAVWWHAGSGSAGCADGPANAATFSSPTGLAIAPDQQSLYVADAGNHLIRRISAAASRAVTTLAGQCAVNSFLDGAALAASFNSPQGIAFDGAGAAYVGDTLNHAVRRLSPLGEVSTLGSGAQGMSDGFAPKFSGPVGTAELAGAILVADNGNKRLRRLTCVPCPASFFCASGAPVLCPAGSFCPLSSVNPAPCPAGTFSAAGAPACTPCPGGAFNTKPGSTSCHPCTAGYYCPPGGCSAAPFGVPCGAGNYCPAGSAAPTPCPAFGVVDALKGPSNGPAFDVDVAACLNHCYFGGNGEVSAC
jgi:hypothetical protein